MIAQELDRWYEQFINSKPAVRGFIAHDPVQFPRRFSKPADMEIAAFLAATIAWGRRDLILKSCEKMFAMLGPSPAEFVMTGNYQKLKDRNVHRTFFEGDLKYFCRGFKRCYAKFGSLEKLFASAPDVWQGIARFRQEMAAANKGCYSKHIADPGVSEHDTPRNGTPYKGTPYHGAACKRINLALRWLVRKGPVDLGLWKSIKPAALYIPLDVHVARTARRLDLLQRSSNDKKAVVELTEKLREFCPQDPVKYDFALFSL